MFRHNIAKSFQNDLTESKNGGSCGRSRALVNAIAGKYKIISQISYCSFTNYMAIDFLTAGRYTHGTK